jgi:hypothetical protein
LATAEAATLVTFSADSEEQAWTGRSEENRLIFFACWVVLRVAIKSVFLVVQLPTNHF